MSRRQAGRQAVSAASYQLSYPSSCTHKFWKQAKLDQAKETLSCRVSTLFHALYHTRLNKHCYVFLRYSMHCIIIYYRKNAVYVLYSMQCVKEELRLQIRFLINKTLCFLYYTVRWHPVAQIKKFFEGTLQFVQNIFF